MCADALANSAPPASTWVSPFVRAMVTLALLVMLFRQIDPRTTLGLLAAVPPGHVLLAFGLALAVIGMEALRWRLVLSGGQIRLTFRELYTVSLISNFFNLLLPSRVGGEAARLYYVSRLTGRPAEVILSILIDRCIGVVGLMTVPWLVVLARRPGGWLAQAVGLVYAAVSSFLVLAIVLGCTLSRHPMPPRATRPEAGWRAHLFRMRSFLYLYAKQKALLLQALGIAVASHILNISIYVGLAAALGEGRRVLDFFYFIPMISLATLLPVSLGGIGIREWTFVSLFTELGVGRQIALSISLLTLLVKVGTSLIGAALYLLRRESRHGETGTQDHP